VKFIFPDKHFVFLHDTPSKSLFDRESRTFSSGCIRVENPFELARTLLNDPQKWSGAEIDKVVKSEKTRTVCLNRPMPVVILYWRAYVDEHGQVHFMDDVYERDNRVLKDLNAGFRIRERELKGRR
jgi:murein L,D-transpeptidase YcbB/YkuD